MRLYWLLAALAVGVAALVGTLSIQWSAPAAGAGIVDVRAGEAFTCAVTSGGGLRCWGRNWAGQLGDGTLIDRPTAGDVSGLTSGAAAVAPGGEHACALTAAGGVKCWGLNSSGQHGDGTISPFLEGNTPVDVVGLGSGVAAVASGGTHSCALLTTGNVKCWGGNSWGMLGEGQACGSGACLTPVSVCADASCAAPLSGVLAIAVGRYHNCALLDTGGVKCWGLHASGQVGDGSTCCGSPLYRSTPVNVVGLSSGVVALGAGSDHSCAVLASSAVKCWGTNFHGKLGDGTTGDDQNPSPLDVAGLTQVEAVSLGGYHTCALDSSGGILCWGDNSAGQLGDGTTTDRPTPGAVVGLGGTAAALSAGGLHNCALTTGGDLRCWGHNLLGQLGDGTTTNRSTPVDVVGPKPTPAPTSTPTRTPTPTQSPTATPDSSLDTDGDTLPDVSDPDDDGDGCDDARELGANGVTGGQRDPLYFWDFFDVPTGSPPQRDRRVNISDIGAVIARFGATRVPPPSKAEALAEALAPPPPAPAYHAAYDRGGSSPGQDPWDLLPPDGSIRIGDIGGAVVQFGHTCA